MTRFVAISLGLLVFFAGLMTYVVFGQRRVFPGNGKIVFEMGNNNYDVYSVQPNSSFGERLNLLFQPESTFSDRYVTGLDCSPDRRSLIFWYIFLYRFDLASEALTQLTLGQGLSQQSVWSPDGQRIAFIDDITPGSNREIFTIAADGSRKTQVTTNRSQETSLSWSPDS